MIRQFTGVLARIIGLKSAGQYQEALKETDQTLELFFGIDAELIKSLDDESLYAILMKNEALDVEKPGYIAYLFKEAGDIYKLQNQKFESINCYVHALHFSLKMSNLSETSLPSDISQMIDELIQKLDTFNLEENTLWDLFCHYENEKEFAKADQMLSRLAARIDSKANAVDEMKSFYKRLLELSDKELATGGMSQAGIQQKLKELE
jgi:tetratricopeptide (TPR) repeat protein